MGKSRSWLARFVLHPSPCTNTWRGLINASTRPLAVVTGASSGIGLELARECAQNGFDLVVAADRDLSDAVEEVSGLSISIEAVRVDLATPEGIRQAVQELGRPADALLANAGHGLGKGFLDQSFDEVIHVIDANTTGTLALIHKVGNDTQQG
ncbi:MAG: oxidoreductase [Gammaproteobacteria bacterium]|nr:oxidoreductase [Gammaproteobacteria bacterium]